MIVLKLIWKNKICSLVDIPSTFNYKVNILYYSKGFDSFSFEKLFENSNPKEISPLYYLFIAQLGDFIRNKLIFHDFFYNIEFIFIDTLKTKEEKKQHLQDNIVSIIWIDNPYIEPNINVLFNSLPDKGYTIITVTPKTNTHCFIQKNYKTRETVSFLEINFPNNYYINVNAYSGIRYLMNNIILLCDWNNYSRKEDELPEQDKEVTYEQKYKTKQYFKVDYKNHLTKRVLLFDSILKNI